MRHLTAEVVERLHRVAGHLVLADARTRGVDRALGHGVANRTCLLDDRDLVLALDQSDLLHQLVAVGRLQVGEVRSHRLDERVIHLVDAEAAAGHAELVEQRRERRLHEPVHELALLHDRDGVDAREPGHPPACLLHLATGCQQDRLVGSAHQDAVQGGRLVRDQLRTQRGQVADVLVLP